MSSPRGTDDPPSGLRTSSDHPRTAARWSPSAAVGEGCQFLVHEGVLLAARDEISLQRSLQLQRFVHAVLRLHARLSVGRRLPHCAACTCRQTAGARGA